MGELLDRQFQKEILDNLKAMYPRQTDLKATFGEQTDNRLLVNLSYLHEHGLIDLKSTLYLSGEIGLHYAKITAKGMDFIADDGGLSAILNVLTVKLHEDTIKSLLIDRIQASDAEPNVKDTLIQKVKSLPAESLGSLVQKGLDAGLEQLPNLPELIGKWLSL